jgi:hypothetical protein
MTRFTPLWLQDGNYAASIDRRLLGALWPTAASGGLACTVQPGTNIINVAPGAAAIPTQNNTGSVLCVSDAVEQVELAGPPTGGQQRYDLIICFPRGIDIGVSGVADFVFTYVSGQAVVGPPAVPATPIGTVALARVLRIGGSASVQPQDITDTRPGGTSLSDVAVKYQARAFLSANIAASNADYTPVPLNAISFDPFGCMVNMGSTAAAYRCPVAGYYRVGGHVSSTVHLTTTIFKNGLEAARGGVVATPTGTIANIVCDVLQCAAGDLLSLRYFTGGANIGGTAVGLVTYLTVERLTS